MKPNEQQQKKDCYLCAHGLKDIDYKDMPMMQRFTSPYYKILSRRKTGTCAKHQRRVTKAVKRARYMSLIPYTNR